MTQILFLVLDQTSTNFSTRINTVKDEGQFGKEPPKTFNQFLNIIGYPQNNITANSKETILTFAKYYTNLYTLMTLQKILSLTI